MVTVDSQTVSNGKFNLLRGQLAGTKCHPSFSLLGKVQLLNAVVDKGGRFIDNLHKSLQYPAIFIGCLSSISTTSQKILRATMHDAI